jgi:hypothetical protein
LGGSRTPGRYSCFRAIGAGLALLALSLFLAACGGGSSADSNEAEGHFDVDVSKATLPTLQRLGQTSLMRIDVHNSGDKTVPAVTVSVTTGGKEGETSRLPFGVRDPQPNLAQPDRPVWVLAEGYPHLNGSKDPGGAGSSSPKTFDLGALPAGEDVEAVWKLSAVRPGHWTVAYAIDAGLSGKAKAKTANGVAPGGTFEVEISRESAAVEVNDAGEVIEIGKGGSAKGKGEESGK